jgi:hypothetical protein
MTSLVIPSWRSRRERAMSSSSFFKTLPFVVHPLACPLSVAWSYCGARRRLRACIGRLAAGPFEHDVDPCRESRPRGRRMNYPQPSNDSRIRERRRPAFRRTQGLAQTATSHRTATTWHTRNGRVDLTFWRFDLCGGLPRANKGSSAARSSRARIRKLIDAVHRGPHITN